MYEYYEQTTASNREFGPSDAFVSHHFFVNCKGPQGAQKEDLGPLKGPLRGLKGPQGAQKDDLGPLKGRP